MSMEKRKYHEISRLRQQILFLEAIELKSLHRSLFWTIAALSIGTALIFPLVSAFFVFSLPRSVEIFLALLLSAAIWFAGEFYIFPGVLAVIVYVMSPFCGAIPDWEPFEKAINRFSIERVRNREQKVEQALARRRARLETLKGNS